ncbi:DnaJ domain [Macleaya cordata]|uniref:DnaJ domain n=1 Tax=Macleaya cordata TaxID=56857 RepID=A0A200R2L2_MACCD|nr:DnaJ domain [Macleaya cordata]
MSRGQSQTRTQSGRRILERCKGKEKINNVVLIDVDSCESHDFIIVDVPESSEHILQRSRVSAKEKTSPSSNIISIDDDDDPGNGDEGGANLESNVTPRNVSRPVSSQSQNSEESDSDECEFTQERTIPLNLSKCKRTYSGKRLSRNRFGLYSDSESSSSESESSDCEVMEGSSGKIRDQWERAASRKKMFEYARNGRSGLEDQASASGSFTDAPENVELEKTTEQDSPGCYRSNNRNDEGEDLSTSTTPGDGTTVDPFLNPMENDFVMNFDHTFFQGSPSCFKTQSWEKTNFPHRNSDNQHGGKKLSEESSFCDIESDSDTDINYGGSGLWNQEKNSGGPRIWSSQDSVDRQSNSEKACFQDKEENDKEENVFEENIWFKTQSTYETYINHDKTGLQNEEVCASNNRKLDEPQVNCDKLIPPDKDEGLPQEASYDRANNGVSCSMETKKSVPEETIFCNTQLWNGIKLCPEKISCSDKEQPPLGNQSSSNAQRDETEVNHERACHNDGAEMLLQFNNQPQEERSSLLPIQEDSMHDIQNDLISKREKFKETDEYKRAMEEEWASRQRELQIQAEEVQRLKKRKKAETLRLLDMEKRQKQRLEEMRETQKKDVETFNLKEEIRAEVRKELDKLELKYSDMASLLRYLGIHVRGGLYPMSREVHAAYKQALLRFHPDRASRTDIRQQVEAEEKFKLISRLKEKLLPT